MSDKIIVTGAAGFIGSHLCEALLARGHRVVGIDSFGENYDPRIKRDNAALLEGHENFTLVEGDICDIDLDQLLGDARCVYHQAAQPGVRQSWHERFDEYIDANIRATHRMCEAARRASLERFVFAGSSSVYGETAELPMSESHPTRPHSPYGVTKLAGEALCLLYRRNYGLPVVSLRYFTVFGPRQRPDMAFHKFIKAAIEGKPIDVYGNGLQTRDFTFVGDIVQANLSAMDYGGEHSVFNIGGGSRVSLNGALDTLGKNLKEALDVRYKDPVKGDVSHTYADIGLARAELGYQPKTSLGEGLAAEVDWVRSIAQRIGAY